MRQVRAIVCLGLLFLGTFQAFAILIPYRPAGEDGDVLYFCGAATVDWMMFRITSRFVEGKLCRDVEALCIASIVAHAIGFALYMAWTPPYFHNWCIKGINYVLAIRLIYSGGSDVHNNIGWRDLVHGVAFGRLGHQTKEAQS